MKTSQLFAVLTIHFSLAVQIQAQAFLTNGLVAYYPFDGSANDASGNERNGAVFGAHFVPDRFNSPASAVNFGSGAYIVVTNSLHPQGDVTLTYSCWFNAQLTGVSESFQSLINIGPRYPEGTNTESELAIAVSGGLVYFFYFAGGNDVVWIGEPLTEPEGWHQAALTKTATQLTLFLDGRFFSWGTLGTGQNVSSKKLYIGSDLVNQFYGALDDVRIYNRALSASEVRQLYLFESSPSVDVVKAVRPSFRNLIITTNYQLQVSSDMKAWTNQGPAFTATDTSMIYPQYFDVDNLGQLFFRLQVAR